MFLKTEEGGAAIWDFCVDRGTLDRISCYGKNDDATKKADNLIFKSEDNGYRWVDQYLDDIERYANSDASKYTDELGKKGNDVAHFTVHRLWLVLQKVYNTTVEGRINKIVKKLYEKYSQSLTEAGINFGELNRIVGQIKSGQCKSVNVNIDDISGGFSCLSNMSDYKDNHYACQTAVKNIKEYILLFKPLHSNMADLSFYLCNICKVEAVQEDATLFGEIYTLYNEIECFLEEEKRLDTDFCEKAEKIIAKESKDKAIVIKESAAQDVMQILKKVMDDMSLQEGDKDKCQSTIRELEEVLKGNASKGDLSQEVKGVTVNGTITINGNVYQGASSNTEECNKKMCIVM